MLGDAICTGVAAPRLVACAIDSNVAGIRNVGTRAGCARALWANPTGHRDWAGKYLLDDRAHRSIETTGCIHSEDDQTGILFNGILEYREPRDQRLRGLSHLQSR